MGACELNSWAIHRVFSREITHEFIAAISDEFEALPTTFLTVISTMSLTVILTMIIHRQQDNSMESPTMVQCIGGLHLIKPFGSGLDEKMKKCTPSNKMDVEVQTTDNYVRVVSCTFEEIMAFLIKQAVNCTCNCKFDRMSGS
jgi:hypothetical protein